MNTKDKNAPPTVKLEIIRGDKMMKMDVPPREDLVENLIGAKSLTFLAGEEGCGKSLLVMNLAISLVVEMEIWLSYLVKKKGKVLFMNNEVTAEDFTRRLKTMMSALPDKNLSNLLVSADTPLIRECWPSINETCEKEKPVLVVVDCLYLAHDEDENDSTAMRKLMRYLLSLRNRFNLAVLVVHHTRKGARQGKLHNDLMRGSGVFGGATDTVLMMRRADSAEDRRVMKPTKGRHIADRSRRERYLQLDDKTLWFRDIGEVDEATYETHTSIDWQIVFGQDTELKFGEILKRCGYLNVSDKTVQRSISDAVTAGQLRNTRHGIYAINRSGGINIVPGVS